ncbi:hypothetical protein V5739_00480 [Salinimicrobium sp. TIG7-5_MAKvit]|uniref:hypothetical protein n=1 Tax=Salinimicrobium sp. TIG7-5_MAKvit TaxID=3121289 RepID=UPI003C6E2ED3
MSNLKLDSLSLDRLMGDAMLKLNYTKLQNLQSAERKNHENLNYRKGGSHEN